MAFGPFVLDEFNKLWVMDWLQKLHLTYICDGIGIVDKLVLELLLDWLFKVNLLFNWLESSSLMLSAVFLRAISK